MAFLRFRLAYIIVAVLRSTALRRVVDGSLDHRHRPNGDASSSLHPGVNTVRPHPFGLRALRVDTGAPPTAQKQSGAAPLVRRVQKAVRRTFAREVDRPFHITAGTVGHLVATATIQPYSNHSDARFLPGVLIAFARSEPQHRDSGGCVVGVPMTPRDNRKVAC